MARRILGLGPVTWVLLAAVPAAVALSFGGAPPALVFAACGLGIVPLAGLMGEATEALAHRSGPAVGGLLNATFGNAAELIITVFALRAGLIALVKASLIGSILGNLLVILGLSIVAASWRVPEIRFSATAAAASLGMMVLAVAAFAAPALYAIAHPAPEPDAILHISDGVAIFLVATYLLSLLFTLRTHRTLLTPDVGGGQHHWGPGQAVAVLAVATAFVAWLSEILVGVTEQASHSIGLSEVFLGLVVIPVIGNAAEHATAVVVARKGQMELAFQIATGSSTQVALFVAPLLVGAGHLMGRRMDFAFTSFEVAALGLTSIAVAFVALDGKSNWFEGVQLLGLYGVLAVVAFFI
ncbi:MAG: calcium/proton exchanger [Gemmatimonadales bacterium]|nr:calcium/proton exchanger [Gemmatimonadales bacterium]